MLLSPLLSEQLAHLSEDDKISEPLPERAEMLRLLALHQYYRTSVYLRYFPFNETLQFVKIR